MSDSNVGQRLKNVKNAMGAVTKSSSNPFFKSKYADLNTHLTVVEKALEENDFILTQPVQLVNGKNVVVSRILDATDGNPVLESVLALPEDLTDMQKLGGAITYARRYTLSALFAMQAEDDDGNTASGKVNKVNKRTNKDF